MKKILFLTYLFFCAFIMNAQETMYIMKGGAVVGQHVVSEVDSLMFYEPSSDPIPVTSLTLVSPGTAYVGDNINLNDYLNVLPSNATNQAVTWQSTNTGVISISGSNATANGAGSTNITATATDGSGVVSNVISITVSAETPNAYYTGKIPNAKYIGRWTTGTTFTGATIDRSFYTGAQIKVNFTGTTAKLNVPNGSSNVNFFVKIDGGNWQEYGTFGSLVNLTPTPLAAGEHTLWIASGKSGTTTAQHYIMTDGLILDSGAETRPPSISNKHIEFIGDSISTITYGDANPGEHWNWLIGEATGWEHTHVAWPGGNFGVIDSYDKIGGSDFSSGASAPWNYSLYTPDAVVINLGQNGGGSKAQYENAFNVIRQDYPNAVIFGIGLFADTGSRNASAINCEAAVNTLRASGDLKIHFLGEAEKTTTGDVHPKAPTSAVIASKLTPAIKTILGL